MPLGTETARWQAPRVPSHRSGASGRPSSSGRGRAVASGRKQNGSATRHWDLRGPLFRECSCDGRSRRGAADPQLPTSRCVILAWPGLDITSSTALPRPLPLRSPSFAGASSGAEVRTVSLIGGGSGRARGGCGGNSAAAAISQATPANRAIGDRIAASCLGFRDRHLRLGFTFLPCDAQDHRANFCPIGPIATRR